MNVARDELDRMANDESLLDSDVMLAAFTVEEVAGWLTIARALRQWADRGQPYAAIPHYLTARLGTPSYPMEHLAPAIDPEGRYCGLDGFYRDDLTRVDWWCLLPYCHGEELVAGPEGGAHWRVNEAQAVHGWDRAVRCQPAPWEPPFRQDRAMAPAWVVIRDAHIAGVAAELDDAGGHLYGHMATAAMELGLDHPAGDPVPYLRRLR